ncbi:DUF6497 family protein [Sulfitobacter aestuarii]|uniref:DUF6497 family protein n=1 Tax=Sulfitobacter aestuarii TaxID=2161676 RepID=A0ABW5U0F1_9RHOB
MRCLAPLPILLCALGAPVTAHEVPSGQDVGLEEVLVEEAGGETLLRFRFVAPAIARESRALGPDQALPDLDHLCTSVALPYLAEHDLTAARMVLSLADRPSAFGVADAEITRFFEAYRPSGGNCIWEGL